jgi:hypothetical protein
MKKLILSLALAVAMVSCTKNEDDNSTITAEEAGINAKLDIANDDVADIVAEEESNTYANSLSGKTTEDLNSTLSNCATVTRVPAFGTPITPGTLVTKTIDFGTTPCVLNNGNTVSGKIIITFTYQPTAASHTITYTFDNFHHNGILFVGDKTFTRIMTVATATSPSHPIVTMNMDVTATFPNGNSYTRVGQRIREIIDGFGTPVFTDNIYRVTGSWTTTFPSTTIQYSTITTPLIVKMSCMVVNKPLLVKGVITIVRNNNTATLDYGDGACDNLAVFTINGNSYNIVIGNYLLSLIKKNVLISQDVFFMIYLPVGRRPHRYLFHGFGGLLPQCCFFLKPLYNYQSIHRKPAGIRHHQSDCIRLN